MFTKFYNDLKSLTRRGIEKLVPILKDSEFLQKGVLTPEEFAAAGDFLTENCKTWEWCSADEKCEKTYLPAGKHYLSQKKVFCRSRAEKIMHFIEDDETIIIDEERDEVNLLSKEMSTGLHITPQEGIPLDLGAQIEVDQPQTVDQIISSMQEEESETEAFEVVEQYRTYNIFITYDKLYRVPRVWLVGFDHRGKPLTTEQMFEDVSCDHMNKTITVESFPFLESGEEMATIHPCYHAETMKRRLDNMRDVGETPAVHLYLVIFLKFVHTIIPTLQYDLTTEV